MIREYNYIKIENNYELLKGKKVIIWCRSISGLHIYKELYNHGITVIGFTDSFANKEGEFFAGLPVYPCKNIAKMQEIAVYVATKNYRYQQEILDSVFSLGDIDIYAEGMVFGPVLFDIEKMKQLIKESEGKIRYIEKNLADEQSKKIFDQLIEYRTTNNRQLILNVYEPEYLQYFPRDGLICPSQNEIFIDAGAYNGETSYNFSKWIEASGGSYSKIYMMEPDPLMFEIMKEYVLLKQIRNVVPVNSGAYSCSGRVSFLKDSMTGSSRIFEGGEEIASALEIDRMVGDDNVTFIKMDIEGAEIEAIKGAKKTIERCKPKLAISIYHRENDLWEIPFYIFSEFPWYKMYIRHYSLTTNETVMYATL